MTLTNQLTEEQQKAVEEKVKQLKRVRDGTLSPRQLSDEITRRRLGWLRNNRGLLRQDLPLPEAAYRLLIYDHMKTEDGVSITMESENSLRAEAKTFCPYLEACRELGMDTRVVCKEIGEPSIVEFMRAINPNLHFSRDYEKIRPYHDCCVEFVEVIK